eukprot:TRINITY_DN2509_c0_g1_i2.p1 TRINITY_DN2509_c0_g1~~TRINITY_DN2509_c0_g1_i2.p1  ORF type:complete len:110 (+),score=11.70 TRINITY_DN2509_c0_g1_i2:54-383(+)
MSIRIPASILKIKTGVRVSVFVKPNARKSCVTAIDDEAVSVQIAAAPKDGEANEELVSFFSDLLSLKKRQVVLEKGGKSRTKLITIADKDVESIYNTLNENATSNKDEK